MDIELKPIDLIDEAINDGFEYIKETIGEIDCTTKFKEYYIQNKKSIFNRLETESMNQQTLLKIISSAFPIFCELAKAIFPDLSPNEMSLIRIILTDLLKEKKLTSSIISTFFKIIEAFGGIYHEKQN